MTEVEFHTGVADPVAYACRLLRKALRQGSRVQVTAAPDVLLALDRGLWTFEPGDFVPHVRMPGAPANLARRSPLWLCLTAQQVDAPEILVNLGAAVPLTVTTLRRVIELVSDASDDVAAGRQRWRQYQALGLPLKHHVHPVDGGG